MKEFFLIGGEILELGVELGLGEPGAGFDGRPEGGVVEAEVPGARAAHGEASEDDSAVVDGIIAFDGLDRLENVGFAGPAVGVVAASEDVEGDFAFGTGGGGLVVKPGEDAGLGDGLVAAVKDDVEAGAVFPAEFKSFGDDDGVGLRGAIDLGEEAAGD